MPLRAWMPNPPPGDFLPTLRALLPAGVELTTEQDSAPGRVDLLVTGTPTNVMLSDSPGLRALLIPYAGVPAETRRLLAAHPELPVHNLHHNAAPTAELALALLLAVAKRVLPLDAALRSGDWRPRFAPPAARTLDGLRALVLGYGAVGTRVARACRGLGMSVDALRRTPPETTRGADDGIRVHGAEALDELLPTADAVLVCLPATPATDGLLDAARLRGLQEGTIIVNVGRGAIIDEEALYAALASGRLGGAGLDVWYRYPGDGEARADTQPATCPFHELENVVMSPHRAGLTRENEKQRAQHLAHLLGQAARGEPLDNPVDVRAGY